MLKAEGVLGVGLPRSSGPVCLPERSARGAAAGCCGGKGKSLAFSARGGHLVHYAAWDGPGVAQALASRQRRPQREDTLRKGKQTMKHRRIVLAATAAMARPPADAGRRPGFTLVEVLVVIAVIALLISMLMPAYGRARERTNLILCRGRLRNVGVGMLLYANDNRSALPVSRKLDNPHTELISAMGTSQYVQNPANYYCPSQQAEDLCCTAGNLQAGNIAYFYYSAHQSTTNGSVSTFLRWSVSWPRKLDTSMPGDTWVMSDIWLSGDPTAHWFYNKGVNYLMLGGGVEMVEDSPRQAFH